MTVVVAEFALVKVTVAGLPAWAVHVPAPIAAIVAVLYSQIVWLAPATTTVVGPVTLTVADEVQPRASVTVTVSIPTDSPVIVDAPVKPVCTVPLDQRNVQGLVVPTGVAVAVPPFGLAQVAAVEVIVGGQQAPTA